MTDDVIKGEDVGYEQQGAKHRTLGSNEERVVIYVNELLLFGQVGFDPSQCFVSDL